MTGALQGCPPRAERFIIRNRRAGAGRHYFAIIILSRPYTIIARIGISPAWEKESPGRNPKSLKKSRKVLGPSGPKSLKKVSGRVRKVSNKSKNGSFETFRTLPETFFRLLGPEGPRTFRDFFQTFGVSARRLLSQVGEIPMLGADFESPLVYPYP